MSLAPAASRCSGVCSSSGRIADVYPTGRTAYRFAALPRYSSTPPRSLGRRQQTDLRSQGSAAPPGPADCSPTLPSSADASIGPSASSSQTANGAHKSTCQTTPNDALAAFAMGDPLGSEFAHLANGLGTQPSSETVAPATGEAAPGPKRDSSGLELTPQRVANRRIKSCHTLPQLHDLIVNGDATAGWNHANISHAVHQLAVMASRYGLPGQRGGTPAGRNGPPLYSEQMRKQSLDSWVEPAMGHVDALVGAAVNSFDAWDVSQVLWSYATLGSYNEVLFRRLCMRGCEVLALFRPVDCANTMVAFARFEHTHPALLEGLEQVFLRQIDSAKPEEVYNVVWGFARLNRRPAPVFLDVAMRVVQSRVHTFGCQELSGFLWALARLSCLPSVEFLRCAEEVVLARLPLLNPQDIANTVWAFAKMKYKAVRLLDVVPRCVAPLLWEFRPEELVCVLYGYARVRHLHRGLLNLLAPALLAQPLDALGAQELALIAWSYGVFCHRPRLQPSSPPATSAPASSAEVAAATVRGGPPPSNGGVSPLAAAAESGPVPSFATAVPSLATAAAGSAGETSTPLFLGSDGSTPALAVEQRSAPTSATAAAATAATATVAGDGAPSAYIPVGGTEHRGAGGSVGAAAVVGRSNVVAGANGGAGAPPAAGRDDNTFCDALVVLVGRHLMSMKPQGLAFVIKAFAHLKYRPPPGFMAQHVRASLRRLRDFTSVHELSMLVYGMSRLSYQHPKLYVAVARHATQLLRAAGEGGGGGARKPVRPTDVRSIVVSCMRVGYFPTHLVDALSAVRGVDAWQVEFSPGQQPHQQQLQQQQRQPPPPRSGGSSSNNGVAAAAAAATGPPQQSSAANSNDWLNRRVTRRAPQQLQAGGGTVPVEAVQTNGGAASHPPAASAEQGPLRRGAASGTGGATALFDDQWRAGRGPASATQPSLAPPSLPSSSASFVLPPAFPSSSSRPSPFQPPQAPRLTAPQVTHLPSQLLDVQRPSRKLFGRTLTTAVQPTCSTVTSSSSCRTAAPVDSLPSGWGESAFGGSAQDSARSPSVWSSSTAQPGDPTSSRTRGGGGATTGGRSAFLAHACAGGSVRRSLWQGGRKPSVQGRRLGLNQSLE